MKRSNPCSCNNDLIFYFSKKIIIGQLRPSRCRKKNIMNQKSKQQKPSQRLHRPSFPVATDALADTNRRTLKLQCRTTTRKPSKIQHRSLSKDQTDSRRDRTTESSMEPNASISSKSRFKLLVIYK